MYKPLQSLNIFSFKAIQIITDAKETIMFTIHYYCKGKIQFDSEIILRFFKGFAFKVIYSSLTNNQGVPCI